MPEYQNTCVHNCFHATNDSSATLQFDCVTSRFFYETQRIFNSFFITDFIRTLRHVADDKCIRSATTDRFCQGNHLIHRYRISRLITQLHHTSRITNQDHVYSCILRSRCKRKIIGRNPRNRDTFLLHLIDGIEIQFLFHNYIYFFSAFINDSI